MINIDKQIEEAQVEWDKATNAYSRYPGTEEWQAFLVAKKKVKELKSLKQASTNLKNWYSSIPDKKASTTERIESFLRTVSEASYADMTQHCHLTKDQLRHGLLRLLKDDKITKIKIGLYKIKET